MKKLAIATLGLLLAGPSFAATLTVTSLADDGSAGTLRALCASAASGDEIVFDDALAGGTIAITTASGPIEIATTLSIVGPEDAPVAIDGLGGANGIAYTGGDRTTSLLYATDADATLTLRNLVFTGSKANQASATPEVGPAVSILGAAVIDNCCWTNNGMAQTGAYSGDSTADGGTCLRVVGDLNLTNSKFVNNGANGCNFSIGGTLSVRGETVAISNCVFSGSYGWGGATTGGNVRGGGTVGVGPGVKDFSMTDCLVEKAVAGAATGGILINNNCSGGVFRFRNCAFRDIWSVNSNWKHGGAIIYVGSNANTLIVENSEFSRIRFNGWGGAIRWTGGSGRVVFANTTFYNCRGSEWGAVSDTRCQTYIVNCTAAGNVNSASQAQGSGTFFVIDKIHALVNCACVWNYNQNGALLDDTSRYGSTLAIYNSYNHSGGNGANEGAATDYNANTAMFAEPFTTISTISVWTSSDALANDITIPVLTIDEKAEKKNPAIRRVVDILSAKDDGVLDRAGWPVKHNADWSAIAYSTDKGATWTALVGSADDATILLSADSRGASYPTANGIPVPPIGSAAVVAENGTMILIK